MLSLMLWTVEMSLIVLAWKMVEEGFMISKKWIDAAAVRAIRTMAQTMIATIGTTTVLGGVNWLMVCSSAVLAGILSVLTSLAGLPEVEEDED